MAHRIREIIAALIILMLLPALGFSQVTEDSSPTPENELHLESLVVYGPGFASTTEVLGRLGVAGGDIFGGLQADSIILGRKLTVEDNESNVASASAAAGVSLDGLPVVHLLASATKSHSRDINIGVNVNLQANPEEVDGGFSILVRRQIEPRLAIFGEHVVQIHEGQWISFGAAYKLGEVLEAEAFIGPNFPLTEGVVVGFGMSSRL